MSLAYKAIMSPRNLIESVCTGSKLAFWASLCMACKVSSYMPSRHAISYPCTPRLERAMTLSQGSSSRRNRSGSRSTRYSSKKRYCIDSGATVHCINDASLFASTYDDHPPVKITVAKKGEFMIAKAVGTVNLHLKTITGQARTVVLHNVVYHPGFKENLLSVDRLWRDSRIACSFDSGCTFKDRTTGDKFQFERQAGSYRATALRASAMLSPELLHSRFGHSSERRINKLRDRCINFPLKPSDPVHTHDPKTCDACQRGGMKHGPFSGKRPKGTYTYFGQKLSSDLCEFPKAFDGTRYLLCIVDAYTNWLHQGAGRDLAESAGGAP